MAWSAELEGAERTVSEETVKLGIKGKELLFEGLVDSQARKALESRGWKVSEQVKLANGGKASSSGKSNTSPAGVGSGAVR